jgi:hypothetical protein
VNDQRHTLTATIPGNNPGVRCTGGRAEPSAGLNGCEEDTFSLRTGVRTPHCQVRSKSLYKVRNPRPDKTEVPGGNLFTLSLCTVTNLKETTPGLNSDLSCGQRLEWILLYIKTQFVLHREQSVLLLERRIAKFCKNHGVT